MQEPSKWKTRTLLLAGIAVLALVLLLLFWGLTAMQWTILSTNNNVNDAVLNGELDSPYAVSYSIPQGVERDFYLEFHFTPLSGASSSSPNGSSINVPAPVSNSTTTTQYYVFFSITNPNGSAVTVWYTSPDGNLTQTCGPTPVVACHLEPTPPGVTISPWQTFFQSPAPGNYTIHMLSSTCPGHY